MPPTPTKTNHASLHRDELTAAIESATATELRAIDADLSREGWADDGQARKRIAERLAGDGKDGKTTPSKRKE